MTETTFPDYIRQLADLLGLKDWDLIGFKGPTGHGGEAPASIGIIEGTKYGTIHVIDGFFDLPPRDIRRIVVHELIHCHFDMAWNIAINSMHSKLEYPFRISMETGIESMAIAIASHFPLPPED